MWKSNLWATRKQSQLVNNTNMFFKENMYWAFKALSGLQFHHRLVFCLLLYFSRWCASLSLSIPLCPTASCCTVSPKQPRSITTTPEAPHASTHRRQPPAALVSSAGFTRCVNTGCRDQTARTCRWAAFPVTMNMFHSSSPGLYRDGDAHVHRWHPGHVWARGMELPGLLWWV